jgi:hypothetical protein
MLAFDTAPFGDQRIANPNALNAIDGHHAAVTMADVAVDAPWLRVNCTGSQETSSHECSSDGLAFICGYFFTINGDLNLIASNYFFIKAICASIVVHCKITPSLQLNIRI